MTIDAIAILKMLADSGLVREPNEEEYRELAKPMALGIAARIDQEILDEIMEIVNRCPNSTKS